MSSLFSDLSDNLRAGLALALFRRRTLSDFRIGIDQVVALVSLSLLIELLSDLLLSLPNPRFVIQALPVFSLSLLLFALAAYLFGFVLKRRTAAVQLQVVAYSASLVIYLGDFLSKWVTGSFLETASTTWFVLLILPGIWLVLILFRSIFITAERNKKQTTAGVLILTGVWLVPMSEGEWPQAFWYADAPYESETDPYVEYRKMDGEEVMYAQPERVQASLAQLAPGRPGVTDLYFIGFAGYAYQDVFSREVHYARRLMDERYGTRQRSLLFVNHLDSRNELPLASAGNLERALKQLATLMQPEEDVLMIYLTSHGSRKHELAVDFWPLPLNDLTPERLRRMLDEAGIAWRIVVVSACYSGGFVEPLQDAQTLVATAAAPDRQSFGCSNENDFTYFGEALFKDTLSRGGSLLQAFRDAPVLIAQREKAEKLEPSSPQLYVGALIEEKVKSLSSQHCGADESEAETVGC